MTSRKRKTVTYIGSGGPAGPGNAAAYVLGKDYQLDGKWGQFGRLEGGSIPENGSIWLDYDHGIGRVDSIFVDASGKVTLRKGKPVVSIPVPPEAKAGEKRLANIWVEGRLPALKQDSLYPVIEESYPVPKHEGPPPAAALLPKTWAKLQSGQKVTIIAWGDSVTAGGNTSDDAHRYQHQFRFQANNRHRLLYNTLHHSWQLHYENSGYHAQ